jgi:hypothetical protein
MYQIRTVAPQHEREIQAKAHKRVSRNPALPETDGEFRGRIFLRIISNKFGFLVERREPV